MVKLRRNRKTTNKWKKCCWAKNNYDEDTFVERDLYFLDELQSSSSGLISFMLLVAWSLLELIRFGFDYVGYIFGLKDFSPPFSVISVDPRLRSFCSLTMSSFSMSWNASEEAWEALDLIPDSIITSKVVYTHGVRKILIPGSYVVVKGRTNPDCLRFSVDFTCGARSMVDGLIALHFNPRLQEGYVVRNCLINGAWGDEETTSTTPFSLRIDEAFELEFFVTGEEFMVSINGRHFCSFRHRVPLERITTIDFIGDLQIDDVETTFTEVYSFMKDEHIYTIPHNERYEDDDNLNLDVPFFGRFQQELNVGGQIEICGKVKLLPHSFYVNLQCGHTLVPHPLVPLHLNPRFSASCGSNAFVRNCWIDGKWLREERAPGFPFSPGYSFTMIIGVEESGYAVWVNKKLIAEYPYQELLGRRKITVDSMYIQGDISLHHVSVHTTRKAVHYDFSRELSGLRL